ncbi:MAG: KAP family NTPase [Pseudomonadota bacterium]
MLDNLNEITFENRDEYQRQPIAEKIIRLLASDAKVSPMVIDGGWGTGKTEFCHKLIRLIEDGESEFKAVYVDAFSADHADEPLMTLLAAILKLLPEADRPSLIQKALPAVRFGIKTTLKAGVSWAFKQDAADIADEFDKDIQKVSDAAINHAVEALLIDHVEAEKSIMTLKNALKELAKEAPIVIFVDELDRCRPNFSLSMLESIKHVFDVEGVQFILVTNTKHLLSSINHCYGISMEDAHRYLDKFTGFSFILPQTFKAANYKSVHASVLHAEELIKSSKLLADSGLPKDYVTEFLTNLVKVNALSLREVETFIRYIEIYHALVSDDKKFPKNIILGYALLRILGVYMFCFKPEQADKLANGYVDAPFITGLMGKIKLIDRNKDQPDIEDLITALIGFESDVNVDFYYQASDDDKEFWTKSISSLFQGGHFTGEESGRVKVISETIETLKLGS